MSEAAGGTLVGGGNKRNGGDVKEGQKDNSPGVLEE